MKRIKHKQTNIQNMNTLENGIILQATTDRLMDSPNDIIFLAIGFIGFLVCINRAKGTLLNWIYFVIGLIAGLAHYDALTDSSIFIWLLRIVNLDPTYFQNADIVVRIVFGFATGVICHFVAQAVMTQTIVNALINRYRRTRYVNVQLELSNLLVKENRWPLGLVQSLTRSLEKNVYHSFIIDDSGSMSTNDGNKVEHFSMTSVSVKTTRWDELKTNVKLFAKIAHIAHAPCEFRFLNRMTEPIIIGNQDNGQDNTESESNKALLFHLLTEGPSGSTPLCRHIKEVVTKFQTMEAELRRQNKSVSMTIFTDAMATDGEIVDALRPLEDFPARTVVRLCTDDTPIVNYWNNIDSRLENFDIDVLDDFFKECDEVMEKNPWLNYAEPIHCIREFGVHFAELDRIDEEALSPDEIKRLLAIILGGRSDDYPHPADTKVFIQYMLKKLKANPNLFNPNLRKKTPLILLDEF